MSISLLIDDGLSGLTYGPGNWSMSPDIRWVGGTSVWPQFAGDNSSSPTGFLNFTFHGTSIAFSGNTPSIQDSQTAFVSIDGAPRYKIAYSDPTPPSYRQWYQSPILSDGEHTISIDSIDGTSVDYMVVTPGESTPLAGQTVVVDDSDAAVGYAGRGWEQNGSMFIGGDKYPNGMPFGNGTHRSSEPGDTATFRFTGTSVSVYGIFIWTSTGSLSATYTIDGSSPQSLTYSATPNSQYSELGQQPNFLLFNSEALDPGNHTLVVNVTQCANQMLVLDYFTYNASFSSLEEMPKFAPFPSTLVRDGANVPIAAIAGASVGAVALVGAVILFCFCKRRRVRKPFIKERKFEAGHLDLSSDPLCFPKAEEGLSDYRRSSRGTNNTNRSAPASPSDIPLVRAFSLLRPTHGATPPTKQRPEQRQAELLRRMQELQSFIQDPEGSGSGSISNAATSGSASERAVHGEGARVAELRRQIEELTREDHGSALAPPAYEGPPVSTAALSGKRRSGR